MATGGEMNKKMCDCIIVEACLTLSCGWLNSKHEGFVHLTSIQRKASSEFANKSRNSTAHFAYEISEIAR